MRKEVEVGKGKEEVGEEEVWGKGRRGKGGGREEEKVEEGKRKRWRKGRGKGGGREEEKVEEGKKRRVPKENTKDRPIMDN
ncbi:hypothetical protein Pcinc_036007 [Petrolisthes cinctipes]|uniref:Uncharacterized protein n=1 Tax=Petrolisthes cinctipes TaxID=88211 RepID=A0AAE1EMS1_PETCI|nr:hypothetical protein Pcinc_036007 [Petrolisthes cinctipes]